VLWAIRAETRHWYDCRQWTNIRYWVIRKK